MAASAGHTRLGSSGDTLAVSVQPSDFMFAFFMGSRIGNRQEIDPASPVSVVWLLNSLNHGHRGGVRILTQGVGPQSQTTSDYGQPNFLIAATLTIEKKFLIRLNNPRWSGQQNLSVGMNVK